MKKFVFFLAIAAMVCTVSCKKDDKNKKGKGGDDTEYVAPVAIDGNFADWAALDATKVQTINTDPEAGKQDLKQVKFYSDEYFVYGYVKYNFTVDPAWAADPEGKDHAILCLFINGDNDINTGGYIGDWDHNVEVNGEAVSKPCFDVMIYHPVYDQGSWEGDWFAVYTWEGTPNTDGWDPFWTESDVENFYMAKGNDKEMEFAITREFYPKGKMADDFTIGISIQCGGWDATGALPNSGSANAKPFTVKLIK